MISLSGMVPAPSHRALFVGQTGCGKTTLAEYLLRFRRWVVVLDGKGEIDWPGYKVITRVADLGKQDPQRFPRLIYRPDPDEWDQVTADTFFRWALRRGHTTVYVDEVLYAIEDGIPKGYVACLTRGRSKGVEVWNAVQRPARVPLSILSETNHVYSFNLNWRDDRKRIEEVSGIPESMLTAEALPLHEFVYAGVSPRTSPRGPLKLQIGGNL